MWTPGHSNVQGNEIAAHKTKILEVTTQIVAATSAEKKYIIHVKDKVLQNGDGTSSVQRHHLSYDCTKWIPIEYNGIFHSSRLAFLSGECVSGWYGSKCEQQCSSHCSSEGCVKDSGYCFEDCRIGYYGGQCNKTCGNNCEQGCDRNSGRCNNCTIFRYGQFCENSCNYNCSFSKCPTRICDRDIGHCLCGCKDRTFGDSCESDCPKHCKTCHSFSSCSSCDPQHWDIRCHKLCAVDCLNQECDRVTGKCHSCFNGEYGDMCSTECPDNCLNNLCYQNGTCQQGCKNSSFYGDQCDKPCIDAISGCKECHEASLMSLECTLCSDGKHGKSCELQCPQNCAECRNETICTHCRKGFTGQICDTVCSVQFCLKCGADGSCIQCEPGKSGKNCEFECPECETCTLGDNNKPKCLTCPKGKYLFLARHLCIDCEGNCESCISRINCTSCKDGYYGSWCQFSCPHNCQTCQSSSNCPNCKTGWTGSKCQCNMKNCITDSDQSKWCTLNGRCLKGCRRGFVGNQCHTECFGDCVSCEQDSGQCKECIAGLYGITCDHNCSVHCADKDISGASICDFHDGSCSTCDHGWYGTTCNKSCNPNCLTLSGDKGCNQNDGLCQKCTGDKFGPFCELDCSHNCYDRLGANNCHKDNGTCVGCTDGFYGFYCNESCNANCKTSCEQLSGDCDECISAFYGRFCEKRCAASCGRGEDSKMIVCNRFSGDCLFCKEGYYGEKCDLPCNHLCALGSHKPICDKANGRCQACMPGYHGRLCEQKCSENCGIAEGETGDLGPCDINSSICLHGCAKGWFNRTCLEKCNSKCRDETCNFYDGKCTNGCIPGYDGDYCSLLETVGSDTVIVPSVVGTLIIALIVVFAIVLILRHQKKKKKNVRTVRRHDHLEEIEMNSAPGETYDSLTAERTGATYEEITGLQARMAGKRETRSEEGNEYEVMLDENRGMSYIEFLPNEQQAVSRKAMGGKIDSPYEDLSKHRSEMNYDVLEGRAGQTKEEENSEYDLGASGVGSKLLDVDGKFSEQGEDVERMRRELNSLKKEEKTLLKQREANKLKRQLEEQRRRVAKLKDEPNFMRAQTFEPRPAHQPSPGFTGNRHFQHMVDEICSQEVQLIKDNMSDTAA